MNKFRMIALVRSQEEAKEMEFIYKISSTGLKSGYLGREARHRMEKGDFCNIPKNTKKIIDKIIDQEMKKLKGYD